MPKKLVDMTHTQGTQKLSGMNDGAKALVKAIIDDNETATISTQVQNDKGTKTWSKKNFFNHLDDRDPAYAGAKAGAKVKIAVYYMPANAKEYNSYEVVDKQLGLWSGRRRLVVREDDRGLSFYQTSHPNEKPGLRTNAYGQYIPIDCNK